ncbi:MAG: exodeoxyribonuclease VII small subunit [Lachnospiraceae bacterium]|nr:exodeoxyribonuclease VII small subunit [Lachnospiraceae bacterium]MBQ9934989.1 exodeoxyribonuclease VII small subunit [Lachnospiraceae bacterium]
MDNNMIDNEFSVEKAFERLAEINSLLENPQVSLKDSLALYTEGVKLVDSCKKNLEDVEKEIKILNEV